MSWVLNCFNIEATVRAFFCLQKKPNLTLNCAYYVKFFGSTFFSKKVERILHTNQNLKRFYLLNITLSLLNIFVKTKTPMAVMARFAHTVIAILRMLALKEKMPIIDCTLL